MTIQTAVLIETLVELGADVVGVPAIFSQPKIMRQPQRLQVSLFLLGRVNLKITGLLGTL